MSTNKSEGHRVIVYLLMRCLCLVLAIPLILLSCLKCEPLENVGSLVASNGPVIRQRFFSINDTRDYDWPGDSLMRITLSGVDAARRRARQLAELKWMPRDFIPSCYGSYSKGEEQTGAPYSLTYMTNTQLGTQVSLHTFMTALQNPHSLIYTENLRKAPYYGAADSAPYYGTTCSNSIMFVLGINVPYYTRMLAGIPGIKKTISQTPDSIELCDILWRQGHVMMVYDIVKDSEGRIQSVSLFETTRTNKNDTWIFSLPFDDFVSLWERNGLVRYQYDNLSHNTVYEMSVFVPLDDEPHHAFSYNYEICSTLGDRCSYLEGDDVELAVLSDGFSDVAIYRNGAPFMMIPIERPISVLANLPYGDYTACLIRDSIRSGFTHFEVINCSVRYDGGAGIFFDSKNASPEYIVISDSNNRPLHYYSFTEEEKRAGHFYRIKLSASTHCFRVYYKGRYGVIASDAIDFR